MGKLLLFLCLMTPLFGEVLKGKVVVVDNKSQRIYLTTLPKKPFEALVIVLHGGGGTAKRVRKYSRFDAFVKEQGGFGVVYPQGEGKFWNDGRKKYISKEDDVAFLRTIIQTFKAKGVKRFYLVGISNGGLMVQRFACEYPEMINGIAVVAATQSDVVASICPSYALPLQALFVFGTKDNAFLDDGRIVSPFAKRQTRGYHKGIDATIAYWVERNGCADAQKRYIDKDSKDTTAIEVYRYERCREPLVYYKVIGGGHRWPDTQASNGFIVKKIAGVASKEIATAKEICQFFHLL